MCGEKLGGPFSAKMLPGSPPRVRGKGAYAIASSIPHGITPACAGKRGEGAKTSEQGRDHPRVCGEKQKGAWAEGAVMGSPPRVRGKDPQRQFFRFTPRITPACAGKRSPSTTRRSWRGDHPRVCGEKVNSIKKKLLEMGSPPRVRGKAASDSADRTALGITPACAGKRCLRARSLTATRDHPRVCGEKRMLSAVCTLPRGSPPRVRGKVSMLSHTNSPMRITPACAGKSPSDRLARLEGQDHPRVCGEKGAAEVAAEHPSGSPPRVRGKVQIAAIR